MNQSNKIFGVIFITFIIYITMRGELPVYLTILRGGGPISSVPGASGGDGAGDLFSSLGDFSGGDISPDTIFSTASNLFNF